MYVLKQVFQIDEKDMIVACNEKAGSYLIHEILRGGNFGKYDNRFQTRERSKLGSFLYVTYRSFRTSAHFPNDCIWFFFYRMNQGLGRFYNGYK